MLLRPPDHLARPFGIEQVVIGFGAVGFLDEIGVHGGSEHVQPD
jgi:hypothetical protein